GRERHPIVGPDRVRQTEFLEGALKDREREFLLGGQQRLTRQQVATGEVRDGQRIAVPTIPEEKFAFVVGTPERIGLGGSAERRPRGAAPAGTPMAYEVVAIEHGVDRADGRQVRAGELLAELFTDFGRTPTGILSLQAHDRGFNRAGSRFACRCARWLRSLKA